MEKRHILFLFAAVILCCLCGCAVKTKDGNEKIKDIEFTVLGEDNIPGELKEIMEQKKEKEFLISTKIIIWWIIVLFMEIFF